MPISDGDRAFMAFDWRWLEDEDQDVRTRHPTAKEQEYGTALMDVNGAEVVMDVILAATDPANRLVVATIDGIPPAPSSWFKSRPRLVRLFHKRFADGANLQPDPSFELGLPAFTDRSDGGGVYLNLIATTPYHGTKCIGPGALGGHHFALNSLFKFPAGVGTISLYARDASATNTVRSTGFVGSGSATQTTPFYIGFFDRTSLTWMDAAGTGGSQMVRQQVAFGNTRWQRFQQSYSGLDPTHFYSAQLMFNPYEGEQAIDIDALQVEPYPSAGAFVARAPSLWMVEQANVDYYAKRTTLHLVG